MNELTGIIENATAHIGNGYFHLNIDGGDPIYRERVYCYELYHQMRLRWPERTEFYLNGEVDKAGHPLLSHLGASNKKPDLLIHRPGQMSGNHTIIEVKSSKAGEKEIKKDLDTLRLFKENVGYQRAIYLIYGTSALECENRVIRTFEKFVELSEIELWLHLNSGEPATHHTTLGVAPLVRI